MAAEATAFRQTEHAASLKGLLRVRRRSRRSLVSVSEAVRDALIQWGQRILAQATAYPFYAARSCSHQTTAAGTEYLRWRKADRPFRVREATLS